ncbi:MAG: TonB-dependent receptor, partial [Sphingomicrobium sp.]
MRGYAKLLAGSAAILVAATSAHAQHPPANPVTTPPAEPEVIATDPMVADEEAEDDIIIVGQRERGAVIGDIPPENQLDSRDVRSYGATNVTELLEAIASQTGSARGRGGGQPIVLLNGQRTSGFREVHDIPPEAIVRVDILPEEVALKYGYRADQRVVNIVLRSRFRSTATRAEVEIPTAGGRIGGEAEASRLLIGETSRTTLTVTAEGASRLTENDRDIALTPPVTVPDPVDPRAFRTLIGERSLLRLRGTFNRNIFGNVSATINGELARTDGQTWFGVPTAELDLPGGSSVLRAFEDFGALTRDTDTLSGHAGLALNGNRGSWRWSLTGNADQTRSVTRTDRSPDVSAIQARIDAGDPTLDPLGDLGALADSFPRDRARSTSRSGDLDLVLNGPLAELPAGRASVTLRVGGDTRDLDSRSTRNGLETPSDLGRDRVSGSASIDLPIAKRDGALSAIGNLSLNANAEIERLSDFGSLLTVGGGVVWSPAERLNLIASWTREEGAPSLQQLGDPLLVTPGARVFDYRTGETVLVDAVSGGNPALSSDKRNVFKIGGTYRPLEKIDLDLRVDYVASRLTDLITAFPGQTPALEAAFPDRFQRDAAGNLIRVDFRPVNFDRADRAQIRWGFNFSKPLRTARPSSSTIDRIRARAEATGGAANAPPPQPGDTVTFVHGADGGPPPGVGPDSGSAGGRPGHGGGGRGGFGGGGRNGGRLQFSAYHTLLLMDEVRIRPGLPLLDYLDGEAADGGGGRSRHQIELEGGWANNGLGARLS